MKLTVDPVTQAVYVDSPTRPYDEPVSATVEYAPAKWISRAPSVNVDVALDGRVIGVEIIW